MSLGAAITIFLTAFGIDDAAFKADTLKEQSAHFVLWFTGHYFLSFGLHDHSASYWYQGKSREMCLQGNPKQKCRIGLNVFCATVSQWLT
jgi:hypothetical protein